jgi:quercetin dioxygenase-like cupin family protein
MKRTALVVALALVVGITLGVIGGKVLDAQHEPVKHAVLLNTDLVGIEGKEAQMLIAEIAPGAESGRHSHPGHEFIYVMEGSGILEVVGKEPVALRQGGVAHTTPRQVHNAKNTGRAPIKAVVFAIYEKGQPRVIPVR